MEKTQQFLDILLKNAQRCSTVQETLHVGLGHVAIDGYYLEMSVYTGGSINFIANLKKNETIHGFDSFEGLPENWIRDDTNYFVQGYFAISGLPNVTSNVILHK